MDLRCMLRFILRKAACVFSISLGVNVIESPLKQYSKDRDEMILKIA